MKVTKISKTIIGDVSQKYLIQTNQDRNFNFSFIHDTPGTSSNIAICIIASGHAHVTANATTIIKPDAAKTNAWLEIKVITRDQAIVTAAPNLEIANKDVQAGHALTTKHISETELFYLMSRGISRAEAKQIIIDATIKPYLGGIKL